LSQGSLPRSPLAESRGTTPASADGAPQADGTPSDGPVQTAMRPLSEILLESAKHGWRDLPGLLARAFGLVWAAGRSEFLLTSALQFVSALGITAQLFMTRVVFGAILAGGHASGGAFTSILPKLAAFVALGMVLDMLNALRSEQSRVLGELVARYAFDRILDVATRVDLLSYESADFHDRLRRAQATGPISALQIATGSIGFFGDIISALGIILGLLALQPLLLPLVLIGYVPLWIVGRLNTRDLYDFRFGMTPNDRMRAYLQRVMMDRGPAKELRSFNLGPVLRERHDRLYQENIAELRSLARRRTARAVAGALAQSALTALAIGGIAYLFVSGHMDLASAGAAVFGLYQLSSRLGAIHFSVTSLYESVLFIRDYDLFLALRPSLDAAPRAAAPRSFSLLQVDDVRFTYPGAAVPAIAGVSIEVRAGEIIALVGENGSGKTTLAKILAGLYEPSHGSVRWDGVDVATVDRDDLRRSIAVVFQDFERYLLTARENVGFGRVERVAESAAVVAAARRADAYDFIQSLPDGLETMLGREWIGGYDLSVGQWQRVALARAFFRDAPFVILDEPTAALDPRAESELFERMRELLEGRSVVLVSHRFSSVRSADRIYVLQRGKVTEHGTHAELMELRGHYADLFRLQANAYLE
jgi:ATP-binding cassette, subfamily B, bacterial